MSQEGERLTFGQRVGVWLLKTELELKALGSRAVRHRRHRIPRQNSGQTLAHEAVKLRRLMKQAEANFLVPREWSEAPKGVA